MFISLAQTGDQNVLKGNRKTCFTQDSRCCQTIVAVTPTQVYFLFIRSQRLAPDFHLWLCPVRTPVPSGL